VKSAHPEASAEACGARPGSTAGLPPALPPPAILPPAPPAPPLSLALAEPSGSALRAPCATQCCSITFSTRPPGLLISPKSDLVRSRGSLDLDGMGRGVRVRAVPGCVVALRRHTIRRRKCELRPAGRVQETETAATNTEHYLGIFGTVYGSKHKSSGRGARDDPMNGWREERFIISKSTLTNPR
jgi:hypothetical protein